MYIGFSNVSHATWLSQMKVNVMSYDLTGFGPGTLSIRALGYAGERCMERLRHHLSR